MAAFTVNGVKMEAKEKTISLCDKDGKNVITMKKSDLGKFLRILNTRTVNPDVEFHKKISKLTSDYLGEIGIRHGISGYNYIKSAVIYAVYNPDLLDNIASGLYAEVAKEFNSTPSRIERCIRHAIQTVPCSHKEIIKTKFLCSEKSGFPTNSELICTICDNIWEQLES